MASGRDAALLALDSQELPILQRLKSLILEPCPRVREASFRDSFGSSLPEEDIIPRRATFLYYLQVVDRLRCRDERVLHIQVPEGVGCDLKVRVQVKNILLELQVPEGALAGEVVACSTPTNPLLAAGMQRRLLAYVLLCHLKQVNLSGSRLLCDDGPGGRYRCKIDAFKAMRGRCMGTVLPSTPEGDEAGEC